MGPRRRLALSLTVTGLALLGTGASAVEAAPFQGVEETLSSRSGASSYQLSVTHEPYTNLWDASGSLANGVTSLLAQRWNAESGSAASKRSLVTEHARDVKDGHHSLKPAHSRRRSAASRSEGTGQCQEKRSGVKDLLTGVGSGMHDLVNGVADGTEALVDGVVAGVDGVVGGLTDVLTATVTWLFDQSWGISVSNAENEAFDNEWLVDVGFGNPAQTLKVVLDTGSAVAWTYSPQCCYQENHAFFDPTKSSTYVNRTLTRNGTAVHAKDGVRAQRWNTTYGGDSTTSGYLGYDTMRFGGNQLRIDDVEVGLAQRISGSRARRAMEGLLGFGPGVSSGVQGGWQTPFEALVQDKKLDRPVLSAVLIKANPETGKGGGGHYTFGAVDTTLVAGGEKAVRWANVTSSLYWGSNFEGMSIGNRQISSSNDSDRFVVDTGSALLNLPVDMARRANAGIHNSYRTSSPASPVPWLVPCKTGQAAYEASLPASKRTQPLMLRVAGSSFGIPPRDLVFYPDSPVPANQAGGRTDMCFSSIQEGTIFLSIIGAVFIKNHLVVFDYGGPNLNPRRMGFANRTDVALT